MKKYFQIIGLLVLGAVIGIGSYLYFFTGDERAHWEKIEIWGAGVSSPKTQYYLVANYEGNSQYYINCPKYVRDTIMDNMKPGKEPPAYWCLISPATWYHEKPYIWQVEPAMKK